MNLLDYQRDVEMFLRDEWNLSQDEAADKLINYHKYITQCFAKQVPASECASTIR
jgi:hypothetical protein